MNLEAINKKMNIKLIIEKALIHDLKNNKKFYSYYLYVYSLDSDECIKDYLCDDLPQALYMAKEDYGLDESDFKEVADSDNN